MTSLSATAAPLSASGRTAASGSARTICAAILLLFVAAAAVSALRKDPTQGFDEVAHASYVAQLQKTGEIWPRLETLRMLDPAQFRFTAEGNYLNHPPFYYALLARLGPALEGRPGALFWHRLLNVGLGAIGLGALLAAGLGAGLRREEFYAYAVPLAAIPVLIPLSGAINNDNAAFAAGGVATLAVWTLLRGGGRGWLAVALGAVVAAAWAKLTGLLLVGGMTVAALLVMVWRGQLRRTALAWIGIALAVAAAPYLVYLAQYGGPAPDTPAQLALLRDGAQAAGWDRAPRLAPLAYAAHFATAFLLDWMPALADRSLLNLAALAIPLAALLCAIAGIGLSARRLWRGTPSPLDILVTASALAFAVTFALNIGFSYQRHLATGWMMDAYPRYYLPVAALVPLAGLSLLAAIESPRSRAALLAFLIAGPVLFRLIAAPLG